MNIRSIAVIAAAAAFGLTGFNLASADEGLASIAAINQNKASLGGKTVKAAGTVVKVNNGIMGRNFLHIRRIAGEHRRDQSEQGVAWRQDGQSGWHRG